MGRLRVWHFLKCLHATLMGLQFWAQDPVQPGSQDLETSERFWGWLLRLCLQSLEEKWFPEIKKKKNACRGTSVSVLLGDHTEGYSLGDGLSGALKNCSQDAGEEPGYLGILGGLGKTCIHLSKRWLLVRKDQTSQGTDLSAFLWIGRCKNLGVMEILPSKCIFTI